MSLSDGAAPKSLFIEVHSMPVDWLAAALEHVRVEHRTSGEEDYVYNLVLTGITDPAGRLASAQLDTIAPYLPGGATPAFSNVFVGTVPSNYSGMRAGMPDWMTRSPYGAGILDGPFRWANLGRQHDAWRMFADRFPDVAWHPYIGYEASLSWWADSSWGRSIAAAYEAYLIQSVRDAALFRPGAKVLWSPAVWNRYTTSTPTRRKAIADAVATCLRNVDRATGRSRFLWLHPQDFLGQSSTWGEARLSVEDAVGWYRTLRDCGYQFDSFRLNMELFDKAPAGGLRPLDVAEMARREDAYQAAGVDLGGCWEIRYWHTRTGPNHTDVGRAQAPTVPPALEPDPEPPACTAGPLRIVQPSEWGAQVDYAAWSDPYTPDDKIILHYAGGDQRGAYDSPARAAELLRMYERVHLGKGWRGLAYGWAIDMHGTVYLGRGFNTYGAHRGDLDRDGIPENQEGVPVLFILGGSQAPTPAALAAFHNLRTRVIEARAGRRLPIYGHGEVADLGVGGTVTDCPGIHLEALIDAERRTY